MDMACRPFVALSVVLAQSAIGDHRLVALRGANSTGDALNLCVND
jgi:hypothetical protein